MRPHRLELTAFGAFPGDVDLDLDALGESGLVLLCGDTGGGKTTLLDALGFALYGVVPGERQKAREDLRSHHAPAGARAQVRLELTARGRRLRVTRTPAQHRPKKRGEGTLLEAPTALLERRLDDGTWEPVAARCEDVGAEIGRLLGMDADQFFQVVVLPQGRFAAFLQADHKDREKLLKQLFHVDRFESAERWLADRAATATAAVATARQELAQVAGRVAQAAGAELPDDLEAAPLWAQGLVDGARVAAVDAGAQAAALADERTAAEAALAAAEALLTAQSARRAAEAELADLEARSDQVAALACDLDAARRARPVAVAAAGLETARGELAEAETQAERALADVALCGGTPDDPAAQARAADAEAHRLEHLVDVQARAATADRAARAAELAADVLEVELAGCREWLESLPEQRDALQTEVAAARTAVLALPELVVREQAAQEQARLAEEVAQLESARPGLVTAAEEARAHATALQAEAEQLRNDRVDALIAELAFALQDDCPCPVCGSLAHPDVPVVQPRADVGKEAEVAARRAAEAAEQAAAAAAQAVAVHDERVAGLRSRLAPVDDVTELLTATRATAARLPDAEERLVLLATEGERRYADLARFETRLEEERKRAVEADGDVAALLDELRAAGLEPTADLAALRRSALLLAQACDGAARADQQLRAARTALERATATVTELAVAAGFGDATAAAAAVRPDDDVARWAAEVDDHTASVQRVRARLAELDVPLDVVAPVAERREALALVVQVHEAAVGAAQVATDRERALTDLLPAYDACLGEVGPLLARASSVRALAELVAGRGGNRLSMPLSTFVLAARLEEVAQAASLRLARMSGGRYTLRHTDVGRDKRSRAGLGLSVEDGWTGRTRDTATLSGGETFMTALSLALGLADVVTAEAGGQSIDALFVDEGFGTLDADSLDQVMDVLDELRSGGRLVGVVSHVADLKQRIPAQIRVQKGMHGSTVSTT
ncbi:MAG: SMC family ATPase [Mycobacteriales bacterium]|nr:SMC family ATPase [Mycobacteriales bacterium]